MWKNHQELRRVRLVMMSLTTKESIRPLIWVDLLGIKGTSTVCGAVQLTVHQGAHRPLPCASVSDERHSCEADGDFPLRFPLDGSGNDLFLRVGILCNYWVLMKPLIIGFLQYCVGGYTEERHFSSFCRWSEMKRWGLKIKEWTAINWELWASIIWRCCAEEAIWLLFKVGISTLITLRANPHITPPGGCNNLYEVVTLYPKY